MISPLVLPGWYLTSVRRTDVLKLNAFSFNNIARLTFVNSNKVCTKNTGDVCLMRHTLYNVSRNAAVDHDKLRHDARYGEVYNWKQLMANAIDRLTCSRLAAMNGCDEIAGQSVPEIQLYGSHDSISLALTD